MDSSAIFPPVSGRAFTLWQDPARWPVARLKLPGRSFTLWQDPERWPALRLRLPGRGFTLWLDAGTWPVVLGEGVEQADAAVIMEPLPEGLVGEGDGDEEIGILMDAPTGTSALPGVAHPGGVLESLEEDGSVLPVGSFTLLPVVDMESAAQPELIIAVTYHQNHAFTLWTRPGQVSPIAMKNGMTAAQVAAAQAPKAAVVPKVELAPARLAAKETAVREGSGGGFERWWPLAAGALAVLGVHALISVSEIRKEGMDQAAVDARNQQVALTANGLATMKDEAAKREAELLAAVRDFKTKAELSGAEVKKVIEEGAAAVKAAHEAGDSLLDMQGTVGKLKEELEVANQRAAGAANAAQGAVVAAQEEASRVKRESGAEVVKLREALGRLEAEKAAAVRMAAEAAAEVQALKSGAGK